MSTTEETANAARVSSPLELVPDATFVSVHLAYEGIKKLYEDGVDYRVAWDEASGEILNRFARSLPLEAWLVARPVDADGNYRRDRQRIVCPVAVTVTSLISRARRTSELRALLDELIVADLVGAE